LGLAGLVEQKLVALKVVTQYSVASLLQAVAMVVVATVWLVAMAGLEVDAAMQALKV
jgi:hypothetical protein